LITRFLEIVQLVTVGPSIYSEPRAFGLSYEVQTARLAVQIEP